MLDSLDTLIAFVLIMLVVSLLITIEVQMVSAVLNLRGLSFLSGLSMTFTAIAPNLKQQPKDLARGSSGVGRKQRGRIFRACCLNARQHFWRD